MNVWAIVLLAGAVTLAIRIVPVIWLSSRPVPKGLERIGPLTAPVAFAALAASSLTGAVCAGDVGDVAPLAAAVTVAGIVAHRTRSSLWAVTGGMAALWGTAAVVALT